MFNKKLWKKIKYNTIKINKILYINQEINK